MARMPLLMDECVRKAVCDVFAGRGHEIHYVAQELGQKTPDPLVAAAAEGIRPLIAWSIVLVLPFISMLPLVARRSSFANWAGYASMSVFSMLLVLVLTSDVVRLTLRIISASISARTMSFAAAIFRGSACADAHRSPIVAQKPAQTHAKLQHAAPFKQRRV